MSEISIVEAKPRPIAVVRVTTVLSKWPREFRHSLDKVYAAVKAGRVRQNGQNVMVYRSREDGSVDIECGIEVGHRFDSLDEVVSSETPSGTAVTMPHMGPYEELGRSHQAIAEWSRKNGYQLTGTCWEIYGDWHENPKQLSTDIFHLVQSAPR
jgi:effector-binding domain-containing protein